jgi:hypothetical protein
MLQLKPMPGRLGELSNNGTRRNKSQLKRRINRNWLSGTVNSERCKQKKHDGDYFAQG